MIKENNVLNAFEDDNAFNAFDEIDPDQNHFNNADVNCKTYSIDLFNSNVEVDCQSLNIFHNNIIFVNKSENLEGIFYSSIATKLMIVAISETVLWSHKVT